MHILSYIRKVFVVAFALALSAAAGETPGQTPLHSLVQAEKNFAQMSVEKGIRAAFLANFADNAIVFDPGPVNGKQLYQKRPASDAQLTWQPIFADIARVGDMGYTTGPWEFKKNKGDEKPSAYGQFLSVWKKQTDGEWKVVLDGGIDHAAPVNKQPPVEIVPNELASHDEINLKTARRALAAAEKEFDTASEKDASAALIDAAAPDIRVFRNGRFPAVGRDAAQLMIGYDHGKLKAKAAGGAISRSGDLAYSYGEYTNERLDGVEHGYFVTIWRMSVGGEWQLAVDVRRPDPSAGKKAAH